VVSITATCGHSRKVPGGKTLEVVPDNSLGSDKIVLTDQIDKGHGGDPQWTVSDATLEGLSFKASGPTTSKLWIPSASPRVYTATCKTCSGSSQSLTVNAYPNNKLKAEFDLDKLFKVAEKIGDYIKELLEIVTDRLKIEGLHVKGSFEAAWKEAKDPRAFYSYKIALSGDLIEVSIEQTIGPDKIGRIAHKIPKVGKYIDDAIKWLINAGIKLKAAVKVGISLSYERKEPDQPKFTKNLGSGVDGGLTGTVTAGAGMLHGKVFAVELALAIGATISAEIELEDEGVAIKPKLNFDGIKGTGKIILLGGWFEASEEMVLVDPRPIWEGQPIHIGPEEHHAVGGGGGGAI
jgi:hypothetical protein